MDILAAVEGVCDTPLHIYHLFVGDSFIVDVIKFCFSQATVGAYRIRPPRERTCQMKKMKPHRQLNYSVQMIISLMTDWD